MMKIRTVETQPPPNFHAAAPARIVRKGPCIDSTPPPGFKNGREPQDFYSQIVVKRMNLLHMSLLEEGLELEHLW